ncbi:MAG TPA: hypothetical protein VME21_15315, partial [Steroidobacteraceae bacterium]|nr:hypothetical protein [Steroidobacteraceae bacterium]
DMVYVGTGQLIGLPDLGTTQTQTVYGVFDAPTNATYAEPSCTSSSGSPCTPLSRNSTQMIPQTLSYAGTINGIGVRVVNPVNSVAIPKNGATWNYGWYVDFNLISGERIVVNPQLESGGGLVVTSYIPNSSECVGGGTSWLQVFNYATGGGFTQPELDVSGQGINSSTNVINGLNPVGEALGSVYASAATLVNCNSTACGGGAKMNNLSNLTVKTVGDRGRLKKRIGWWEVRH